MLGSKLPKAAEELVGKATVKTGWAMPEVAAVHPEQHRHCSRGGQTWVRGAAATGRAAPARVDSPSAQVQPRREPHTAQAVSVTRALCGYKCPRSGPERIETVPKTAAGSRPECC